VLTYLNGHFLPRSAATISVDDRGFVFGDGVYEVWRAVEGGLFESERHLERLVFGLRELRIAVPEITEPDVFRDIATRLLTESGLDSGEATVYVQITRGVAPRSHQFPSAAVPPTVFATASRLIPPEDARAVGVSAITIPDIRWSRCDIKTLQLLPNVFAKQAAVEVGATDALMIRDGLVTEGSHTNVLAVIDGVIRTHPTNHHILPGVTRSVVLEIAGELGIPVVEEAFTEQDIARASELFLAGTTSDVMPVVLLNHQRIGTGVPGPISRRLFEVFRARLDACQSVRDSSAASTTRS
jgi:D-alanine transaminase